MFKSVYHKKFAKNFAGNDGRTQQKFADQCDINKIVKHHIRFGVYPENIERIQRYGDISDLPDFQTAKNMMLEAEEVFNNVPVDIRKLCDHDPAKTMEFILNPENKSVLEKHGMLKKREPEKVDHLAEMHKLMLEQAAKNDPPAKNVEK